MKSSIIGRGFKNPHFTLIGRFGVVDPDTSVTNTNDNTQYTLGVNYRPTETVVYKLEYEMNSLNNGDTLDPKVYASVAVGF